jgi:D-alanyl-D-alanine carboxypeptidase/D-alanyl-D-alanine-endopeptidase (penicillin-binding protein 4)
MKFSNALNIFIAFSIPALMCMQAIANDETDKVWNQQLRAQAIIAKDQSYCYTDEQGVAQGANLDMKIRLASVSKLLTSLWSIDKLGMNYKYDTKLFIKGNNLHIQGSYDPYLGDEKMFFLISQLNELGYNQFDTITFDKNVIVYPDVAYEINEYPTINAVTMGRVIKKYFNTASWSAASKDEYANFYNMAKTGKFRKEVSFEVQNVNMVDSNPFAGDDTVKVLTLSSPGLYKYLKQMNIKSNN